MPDEKKQLFILSPIGGSSSEERPYFNKVKKYLIGHVCSDYKCIRADDINSPGRITTQIIDHIIESDLIIADLSRLNPNVFYELAIAHAADKPVILIATHGTEIPFDVTQERVVFYTLDPEDLEKARKRLGEFVESVGSDDFIVDSPVKSKISIERTKTVNDKDLYNLMDTLVSKLDREAYDRQGVKKMGGRPEFSAQRSSPLPPPSFIDRSYDRATNIKIIELLRNNMDGLSTKDIAIALNLTESFVMGLTAALVSSNILYASVGPDGDWLIKLHEKYMF